MIELFTLAKLFLTSASDSTFVFPFDITMIFASLYLVITKASLSPSTGGQSRIIKSYFCFSSSNSSLFLDDDKSSIGFGGVGPFGIKSTPATPVLQI